MKALIATAILILISTNAWSFKPVNWNYNYASGVNPVTWDSQDQFDTASRDCYDFRQDWIRSGHSFQEGYIIFSEEYGCHRATTSPRDRSTTILEQFDSINDGTSN